MKMITTAIVALFAVSAFANDPAPAAATTAPAPAAATATKETKTTKTTKTKETKSAAATAEKKDCSTLTGDAQKACMAETTPAPTHK